MLDADTRLIPSVVLVQNYDDRATAFYDWNKTITADDGIEYLVRDAHHIEYDLSTNDGGLPSFWGTLVHEYAHNFLHGQDLYGAVQETGAAGGRVGYWDMLASGYTPGAMPNVSSYFKERIGWMEFKEVVEGTNLATSEYRLRPYQEVSTEPGTSNLIALVTNTFIIPTRIRREFPTFTMRILS